MQGLLPSTPQSSLISFNTPPRDLMAEAARSADVLRSAAVLRFPATQHI
jgi:hypothetical protein